ncbi:type IV secretion system protein [Neorhizobium sp. NCHU2750]|uniref:type IV secretion system protein n=1 Tax=Neorhizobium sp. NCHU2750 TaxID=1825976 RepID=UPI000E75FE37|nr:type IV secretion protein AvhB6 [Neorhizobium sp. NCHU2750]
MEDVIGALLDRVEQTGAHFCEQAYGIVGQQVLPVMTVLFIAYVGFYGLQLLTGTARVTVGEIIGRLVRMLVILALLRQWQNFDALFYDWLSHTPEAVGRAILSASGTGISEPTDGLSQIWGTANQAASAFAEQSGYFSVLPSMIGFLIMLCVAVFVAVALAILLLAKVMMWVLVGTAPIFIGCMLFEPSQGLGRAWLQQVLTYALIPLFVYVIAAFLISAMDPELTKVTNAAGQRALQLSDVSAFLLLCCAGAFVLFNIQVMAQGITGGIAVGIGRIARNISQLTGMALPKAMLSGGRVMAGRLGTIGFQTRDRTFRLARQNIRDSAAKSIERGIRRNSQAV